MATTSETAPAQRKAGTPIIPENITVHLGRPGDNAPNITLPFIDYINNVASSEIYPTWPENALRANIYAIVSFTLNRIYTEWYRTQGYNFDITSSTAFDQAFVKDRDIFENISEIADELFNDYIVMGNNIEPYISKYCNGTTTKCDGLSQWGTVDLAKKGMTPYEILQYYYGDDISIVKNAPVQNIPSSYAGPLREGMGSNEIKLIQTELNRISKNYPAIPKIPIPDGVFDKSTTEAVKAFQKIFNLTVDGVVGESTWYKIKNVYNGVKKLGELSSEGLSLEDVRPQFATVLKEGMKDMAVGYLQYYLNVYNLFNPLFAPLAIDGFYGPRTKQAVIAFQKANNLTADGIVGKNTWNTLNTAYNKIIATEEVDKYLIPLYPGTVFKVGSKSPFVRIMQSYLNTLSNTSPSIPKITQDGVFGDKTRQAVIAFQKLFGIQPDGNIGALTWYRIAEEYFKLTTGSDKADGQFGGEELESKQ